MIPFEPPEGYDAQLAQRICYLNGHWGPLAEAYVPVLDRGFLFGDGIYEVVPAYGRRPFEEEAHLDRLERSLAALDLHPGKTRAEWRALIQELIDRHPWEDQFVYLQVSRGVVAKRDHAAPELTTGRPAHCTVWAMSSPLSRPSDAQRSEGLRGLTMPDLRWQRCDIKSIALLGNTMARGAAVAAGADEAILLRDGHLTEGAASNIWVVIDGVLCAPPKSGLLLEGIRLGLMERLARSSGLGFERRPISEAELRAASEILMTSATKEVLPICHLDGQPVGSGRPGPVFESLRIAYDAAIEAHREHHEQTNALFAFPCDFPIKVMGAKRDGFAEGLCDAIRDLTAGHPAQVAEVRESAGGKYQSATLSVRAMSKAQLDAIYHRLTGHPWVKLVL